MSTNHMTNHTGHTGHSGATAAVVTPLFAIAVIAVIATMVVWGWLRFYQGRQSIFRGSSGPTTLVDFADGRAGMLGTTLLCLFGLLQGGFMVVIGVLGFMKQPSNSLILVAVGGGALWLSQWYFRRRAAVMKVAKPGVLVVPHWPLVEGKRIKVAFQRELRGDRCKLNHMFAELQLFETRRIYDHVARRNRSHVELIERHDLGDGGGRQTAEGLHAIWQFHVPHPDGAHPRSGFEVFQAAFGYGRRLEWRLRVHLDVEGLPDVDSNFDLLIRASGNARRTEEPARLAG